MKRLLSEVVVVTGKVAPVFLEVFGAVGLRKQTKSRGSRSSSVEERRNVLLKTISAVILGSGLSLGFSQH